MNRSRTFEIEIDRVDAFGHGVSRLGSRQVTVPFTIPGERVRVRVAGGRRGDSALCLLEAVIRASPHRVKPRCRHFGPDAAPGVGPCGGCSWQHIAYPEQLRLKSELVTRIVRAAVPAAPAARETLAATPLDAPWGYRQKAHFVFGSAAQNRTGTSRRPDRRSTALVMGHYVRGTRRVIPVSECPVHDERANAAAFRLRDEYARAHTAASPDGPLKSLAFRAGTATSELMGTLVVVHDNDKAVRAATRRVIDRPGAPSSFHINVHPKADPYVFGRETRRVSGGERLREEVAGASFLISPTAFFQTNVRAASILVRLVLERVPADARVLDLYAGAGLFALPLALRGHHVLAVEENRAAVEDGEASRRLNRIDEERCRFVARRAEDVLRDLAQRPGNRPPFGAAVLDPPREGCAPAVIDALFGALAPPTVVYVSCNPEALATDLAAIARLGYRIDALQPVDMFPHTPHIETVVTLQRRNR